MQVIRYVNSVPLPGPLPALKISSQAAIEAVKRLARRMDASAEEAEEYIPGDARLNRPPGGVKM